MIVRTQISTGFTLAGSANTADVVGKTLFDFLPPIIPQNFVPKIFAF
jgi:hypothetical protein